MGVLGSNWVLLGVLPVLAVFLTSFVRRSALRFGVERHPWWSLETVNVGADLAVLAAVTSVTTLVTRTHQITSLQHSLPSADTIRKHLTAGQSARADRTRDMIETLTRQQLGSALLLAAALAVAFIGANLMSEYGYVGPRPGARTSAKQLAQAVTPSRRAVFMHLFAGLGILVLVLATAGGAA